MRARRIKTAGQTAAFHCLSRTVAGQFLFGEREREAFHHRMRKLAAFCQIQMHTYTILSNHFHLVLRVPGRVRLNDEQLYRALRRYYGARHPKVAEFAHLRRLPESPLLAQRRKAYLARMGDLSVFMKELKEGFSKWFNALHQRFGTLWAERFRSIILPLSPHVLVAVCAYADLNAVRAGLTPDPALYRHCGYAQARTRAGPARRGLSAILPGTTWADKHARYRQFLYQQGATARDASLPVLDPNAVWEQYQSTGTLSLKEALLLKVRYFTEGIALGSAAFVSAIFRRFRKPFCRRRTQGAYALGGADWNGLACLKKIKNAFLKPKKQ